MSNPGMIPETETPISANSSSTVAGQNSTRPLTSITLEQVKAAVRNSGKRYDPLKFPSRDEGMCNLGAKDASANTLLVLADLRNLTQVFLVFVFTTISLPLTLLI